MNRYVTKGIVLSRTDFGEADRIITFITPTRGKVRAIAKGSRKLKSKLAAGIELFSVSDLTILVGKGEINTLMSARLDKHYRKIVNDIDRTNAVYDIIKLTEKVTEDDSDSGYFDLLNQVFIASDDQNIDAGLIKIWFQLHLLDLAGHSPDLSRDTEGNKLQSAKKYEFDFERMAFWYSSEEPGTFGANDIKFLRLGLSSAHPQNLARIEGAEKISKNVQPLIQAMLRNFYRI